MNQILYSECKNIIQIKKKKKMKFKLLLYFSFFLITGLFVYFLYSSFITTKEEKFSKNLLSSFTLDRLYSAKNYVSTVSYQNSSVFIIGIIQIPAINIEYPILSDMNEELLKISPCRFYGPYPNEKGNLCIAAHNYDNDKFFSNLYKLSIGDTINILDSKNTMISYKVFQKFEVSKNDVSSTSQNTNGKKEITLVTCNNLNGNRLIVKASEL